MVDGESVMMGNCDVEMFFRNIPSRDQRYKLGTNLIKHNEHQ